MKTRYRFCLLGTIVLMQSCAIGMKFARTEEHPSIPVDSFFLVVGLTDTVDVAGMAKVGTIRTTDKGMSVGCSYDEVIVKIKELALANGANVLKIEGHRFPDLMGSTCHRITGSIYRSEDLSPYEEQILWRADRKLQILDFKADTTNRPFTAATSAHFTYEVSVRRITLATITVPTRFETQLSYFKRIGHDDQVLEHEQVHFDLTELYARKLRKLIIDTVLSRQNYGNELMTLYKKTSRELVIEHDRFDAEVYPDPDRLPEWNDNVTQRLNELDMYSAISIEKRLQD